MRRLHLLTLVCGALACGYPAAAADREANPTRERAQEARQIAREHRQERAAEKRKVKGEQARKAKEPERSLKSDPAAAEASRSR